MGYLLRKIRKNRWITYEDMTWLLDGELPADPLNDLGTQANELSVYHVTENESNLNRIIAALAVNTTEPSNIDFALFSEDVVVNLAIKIKKSKGELADDQVNNWHSDLHELSAVKLLNLAKEIKTSSKRIDRKPPLEVLNVVANSVVNGYIDRSRIKWVKSQDLEKLERAISIHS